MRKIYFISTFFLIISCVAALYFYLFLFRASLLPNSIPRLDIQRYNKDYENILVIGDSFFDPRNPDIFDLQMDFIKNKSINIINVSEVNTGPLHYLYALETYLSHYEFKKVVLIFYGGNDLVDLHMPIDKKDFQRRLERRMQLWEAAKLTIRGYRDRFLNTFKKDKEIKDIIYENLNRNKNSLLINDLFLMPEESKEAFNHFVEEVNHFRKSDNLQIGCVYIPPSRQVDDSLFQWWQEQRINWDNQLMYSRRAYDFITSKLPQFCNWFIKDLTPSIKEMDSKGISPYLKNDPHFHPETGRKVLLREIREALN